MDDANLPPGATGHSLQGPHWHRAPTSAMPPGFVPLRLLLQPSGLVVELTKPDMVLGRHTSADVRLPLPDVSRRHCRFVFADGTWQVFDLDSLNGVFVNDAQVAQATLHDRDAVRLGGFTFTVDLQRRPSDAPADETVDHVLRSIADALPSRAAEPRRQAS